MTWLFETHQLPYWARMFSVVFWFSFPVSFIRLGGFSSGFHFSLTILYSMELVSEEGGNCKNVILKAECSQSGSHVTIIIQNFSLVNLTSTTSPHWVWLPFGVSGPLLDLHTWFLLLRTWLLLILHTQPLTIYVTKLAGHLCTSRKDIWLG